jgi:N-acetylmuramoyl-L-alanine amidase
MRVIERPSPNFDGRGDDPVDMLILHYTGMQSTAAALDRLTELTAPRVSCHWLIDEDGTVYRLVEETARAWHAGISFWAGARQVNGRSIGIELVNPGHEWGYRDFPAVQLQALAELAAGILRRHPIPPWRVLGHSDVAPARKQDPGERFPWEWLAARGIGLWPAADAVEAPVEAASGLARIGYEGSDPIVVAAFQRHWRQEQVDGMLDPGTIRRIRQVASAVPQH